MVRGNRQDKSDQYEILDDLGVLIDKHRIEEFDEIGNQGKVELRSMSMIIG